MNSLNSNMFTQKSFLRKVMKDVLKNINEEEKRRQSNIVINYLLNDCDIFSKSNHICLYLAMKNEEIDTIPLIERILKTKDKENFNENDDLKPKLSEKHIYVPHVEMSSKSKKEMVFYELKDMHQYKSELNDNNKYKILQFNEPEKMDRANEKLFDLIIVPGLVFEQNKKGSVNRLGRGMGYYDVFLSKIPNCYKLGLGFNQQFLTINQDLLDQNLSVPMDPEKDVCINEFICERNINKI